MISMGLLLAIELDDERLAHGHVDVLAQREVADGGLEVAVLLQPRRREAVESVDVVADDDHVFRLVTQLHHVALADLVTGDGDPATVDVDVAVAHELPGLVAAGAPAGPEDDVVEALLEHAKEVLAGDAALTVGVLIEVVELLLAEAVDGAGV